MCPWGLFPWLQGRGRAGILLTQRKMLLSNIYHPIPGHSHSLGIQLELLAKRRGCGCDPPGKLPVALRGWDNEGLVTSPNTGITRRDELESGQPQDSPPTLLYSISPWLLLFVCVGLSQQQPVVAWHGIWELLLLGMWLQDGAAHTASGMGWKSNSQLARALVLFFFTFWESLVAQRKSRG